MRARSSPSNKKKRIRDRTVLVVSAGTYCDGSLTEGVLEALSGFRVVYMTDENTLPTDKKLTRKIHTFKTPAFILQDTELGVSDPSQNPMLWALANPVRAQQVNAWMQMLGEMIFELEDTYRPDCVLLHYGLFASLAWIERTKAPGLIGTVPHIILYHSPGVPNRTVPWLFDGRLRSPEFRLYDETFTDQIIDSWTINLKRMSGDDIRSATCILRGTRHALCWDAALTEPVKGLLPGVTANHIGALLTSRPKKKSKKTDERETELIRFVREAKRPVAFISFGSFGRVECLRRTATLMSRELVRSFGYAVVFHDTGDPDAPSIAPPPGDDDDGVREQIYIHRGFVSYDDIIPSTSLVLFTGSLCLQLTCLKNAVSMLFVPHLTEQFFWAKNYQHFTGIPYIDARKMLSDTYIQQELRSEVVRAIREVDKGKAPARRASAFFKRVKKSLNTNDAINNLRKYVLQVLTEHERDVRENALQM
jgi:hypothetical protein